MSFIELFTALWLAVAGGTTFVPQDHAFAFTDLYGHVRSEQTALVCDEGRATLIVGPLAGILDLYHELAHAKDCLDDGILNGSPGSRPAERPAWVSDYCWQSQAEWYACSLVREGSRQ